MLGKSTLAVIAENEAVHRLICPIDLNLNESSLITITVFALKYSFVLLALLLDFFLIPV
jgi:hypothetical protein